MLPTSTHSKNNVEFDTAPVQAGSNNGISDTRAFANAEVTSATSVGQRTRDMRRRGAISLAAGQTGATASTAPESSQELAAVEDMIMVDAANSQVSAAQVSLSADTVIGDAGAMAPTPGCKPEQVRLRMQAQDSPVLT